MELKNLRKTLDLVFGPFEDEKKTKIIEAVHADLELSGKRSSGSEFDLIMSEFNRIFGKRSRVVSDKVVNRWKGILKHFTTEEVIRAMESASNDEFHKDTKYKHCTLEYFSRIDQIDKWVNVSVVNIVKTNPGFVMPRMNIKG